METEQLRLIIAGIVILGLILSGNPDYSTLLTGIAIGVLIPSRQVAKKGKEAAGALMLSLPLQKLVNLG